MDIIETKGKILIFRLFHEMFENEVIGVRGYVVLQLLQGIQILYYTFLDTFTFTWNQDPLFQVFRTVIKYFQVDVYLRAGGTRLIVGLNISFLLINIFFILVAACILRRLLVKKPLVGIEIVGVQFISVYLALITTVLVIPTFEVYMLSAYCNPDPVYNTNATCFQGLYLGNFVLALLAIILQLTLMGFYVYYFNDFNPLSRSPFASPNTMINVISTIRLIIYPLYVSFDFGNNLTQQFVVAQAILQVVLLYLRINLDSYYSRTVSSLWICIEAYILIFALGGVIEAFLDTDGEKDLTGFLFCLLLAPIASLAALFIARMRHESKLTKDIELFKKNEEVLEYLVTVLPMIAQKNPQGQDIHLEGLLRGFKENPKANISKLVSDELILQGEYDDERRAARNKLWAVFMRNLVLECLKKEKKSPGLRLIMAYVFYHKLNNKYRALFELSQALTYKPSFDMEFYIYRLSKIIEFDLMNEDDKLIEEKGIDYNSLVYFNDGFAAFQKRIMRACRYQKKLFEEVEEKTPDIFRMYLYGHKLMKEKEVLKQMFDDLCSIAPNHQNNLELYARFLQTVLNDPEGAFALQERTLQYANKHPDNLKASTDLAKEKYEINSKTGIVVASGEIHKLGFCISANNMMEELYGYTDKDLVGQNISKIVPEYYRIIHEDNYKKFFEREEETRPILNTERTVYVLNFKGYIVPSSIMYKTLPEINGHLKLVAFITPIEKLIKSQQEQTQCGLLMILEGGLIHGITENCDKLCGMRLGLVHSKKKNEEFSLEKLMPDLFTGDNFRKAKEGGVDLKLDTTKLNQDVGGEQEEDQFEGTENKEYPDELFDAVSNPVNGQIDTKKQRADDKRFAVSYIRVKAVQAEPNCKSFFLSYNVSKEKNYEEGELFDGKEIEELGQKEVREIVKRDAGQFSNKQDIPDDKRKIQEFFTAIKENVLPHKIKSMIRLYILSILSILTVASSQLFTQLSPFTLI